MYLFYTYFSAVAMGSGAPVPGNGSAMPSLPSPTIPNFMAAQTPTGNAAEPLTPVFSAATALLPSGKDLFLFLRFE